MLETRDERGEARVKDIEGRVSTLVTPSTNEATTGPKAACRAANSRLQTAEQKSSNPKELSPCATKNIGLAT